MLVPNWASGTILELDKKRFDDVWTNDSRKLDIHWYTRNFTGTYETLAELANQHFGGSLKGTLTLTAGLGGMGGAQPLAVTMNEGVNITVEIDEHHIDRRLETKYLDIKCKDFDEAIKIALDAKNNNKALSIGLIGNAAEIFLNS